MRIKQNKKLIIFGFVKLFLTKFEEDDQLGEK